MRLFLWGHQPFIEIKIWSRDDGSLPRQGASSGDLRVVRLRPFPKPARTAIHRDTHDWRPFPNSRIYMGTISIRSEQNLVIERKSFF
jgi:hypothetical protein